MVMLMQSKELFDMVYYLNKKGQNIHLYVILKRFFYNKVLPQLVNSHGSNYKAKFFNYSATDRG